jgi:hypothetical protein
VGVLSQHDRALAVYYLWQSLAAGSSHKEAYAALAAYREAGNIAAAEDAEKRPADNNLSLVRTD